ncbi:hypothetical protein AJ80_06310 [Polytolypa hystricis UAMH7299]|uniref:Uncharacterized protein n=1 Tax=Polytolypa hystricis (strain UAMH7299) TaxID=1447883 RepID=A0A2B7XXE6_POLH7|nr:hypothetical protein AJ80_06310 [Polytolypa hystricis UAMH7299]
MAGQPPFRRTAPGVPIYPNQTASYMDMRVSAGALPRAGHTPTPARPALSPGVFSGKAPGGSVTVHLPLPLPQRPPSLRRPMATSLPPNNLPVPSPQQQQQLLPSSSSFSSFSSPSPPSPAPAPTFGSFPSFSVSAQGIHYLHPPETNGTRAPGPEFFPGATITAQGITFGSPSGKPEFNASTQKTRSPVEQRENTELLPSVSLASLASSSTFRNKGTKLWKPLLAEDTPRANSKTMDPNRGPHRLVRSGSRPHGLAGATTSNHPLRNVTNLDGDHNTQANTAIGLSKSLSTHALNDETPRHFYPGQPGNFVAPVQTQSQQQLSVTPPEGPRFFGPDDLSPSKHEEKLAERKRWFSALEQSYHADPYVPDMSVPLFCPPRDFQQPEYHAETAYVQQPSSNAGFGLPGGIGGIDQDNPFRTRQRTARWMEDERILSMGADEVTSVLYSDAFKGPATTSQAIGQSQILSSQPIPTAQASLTPLAISQTQTPALTTSPVVSSGEAYDIKKEMAQARSSILHDPLTTPSSRDRAQESSRAGLSQTSSSRGSSQMRPFSGQGQAAEKYPERPRHTKAGESYPYEDENYNNIWNDPTVDRLGLDFSTGPWGIGPPKAKEEKPGYKFPPPGLPYPPLFPDMPSVRGYRDPARERDPKLRESDDWFFSTLREEERIRAECGKGDSPRRRVVDNPALSRDGNIAASSTDMVAQVVANLQSYAIGDRQAQSDDKNSFAPFRNVPDHCVEPSHGGKRSYFDLDPTVDPWRLPPSRTAATKDEDGDDSDKENGKPKGNDYLN